MRLEAIDGRGPEVRMPPMLRRWIAATFGTSAQRRRTKQPVWLLVKKELHLQQMTFAVAGVWLVFFIGQSVLTPLMPGFKGLPLPVVSILFGAVLAMVIGSLAGAEERQLGTLEWQALLPMPARRQWAVKVGTVFALAALMSFGLPIVLAGGDVGISAWHVGVIVFLTTGSLYVSSLCRTTLRGLIVSGPMVLAVSVLLLQIATAYGPLPGAPIVPPAGLVVILLLRFAFENHRLARQSAGRVIQQALWIAGCVAASAALVAWQA
jgi:hypothetical protein